MKDTILSVIRLIATPVLLMVLGLILLIHPDSASALVAQILGWVTADRRRRVRRQRHRRTL